MVSITEGPYLETAEHVGGFWIAGSRLAWVFSRICASVSRRDAAAAWAARASVSEDDGRAADDRIATDARNCDTGNKGSTRICEFHLIATFSAR
jgi:hypothetical protein